MNYLGIKKLQLETVAHELNCLLAGYNVYYQNLRNFHWNLKGSNFFELHQQFELLYNDAKVKIDEIAERVLTIRFRPLSNFSNYLKFSTVPEAGMIKEDVQMVNFILKNHQSLIEVMRNTLIKAAAVSDEGTIDLIGGFLEDLEKKTWMLDAWLTGQHRTLEVLPN